MEEIKTISFLSIREPATNKKKRIITTTNKWTFDENVLKLENQMNYIKQMPEEESLSKTIRQQIQQKLSGYRQQDLKKKLFLENKFVDVDYTINLLKDSKNTCFYCKQLVQVLYEAVREPRQWSLDRIDNKYGHNKDNVLLACLDCNLKRKTMYHERYAFTKQLTISKTKEEF